MYDWPGQERSSARMRREAGSSCAWCRSNRIDRAWPVRQSLAARAPGRRD